MSGSESAVQQFSLRYLFALTTFAAVMYAVCVPFLKTQPENVRVPLSVSMVLLVLIGMVALAVFCGKRWRMEVAAGRSLFRPGRSTRSLEFFPSVFMTLGFGALTLITFYGCTQMMAFQALQSVSTSGMNVLTVMAVAAPSLIGMVYAITLLTWRISPISLELRDHGVFFGAFTFVHWSEIQKRSWRDGVHGAVLHMDTARAGPRVAVMSYASQSEVETRLREMTGVDAVAPESDQDNES